MVVLWVPLLQPKPAFLSCVVVCHVDIRFGITEERFVAAIIDINIDV